MIPYERKKVILNKLNEQDIVILDELQNVLSGVSVSTIRRDLKDLEKKLWESADKMRGAVPVSSYKFIILGLIFLKYISDSFEEKYQELVEKYNCLAVEMESFALFHNASVLNKKATCLLTISDSFITKEETTSEERQNSFGKMIELAKGAK